jgi:hypothetical protein
LLQELERLDMRIRYRGIRSICGSRATLSPCADANAALRRSE